MTKRAIFNPLTALSSTTGEEHEVSLSSLHNSDIGCCPKCKSTMGTAVIANQDTVFYCPKCRVALPRPNESQRDTAQQVI